LSDVLNSTLPEARRSFPSLFCSLLQQGKKKLELPTDPDEGSSFEFRLVVHLGVNL
jgi:hypothetical protein